ncbi:hypothetical protein V7146_10040 [Gottfriedia acidiceleris]|uniref:hypothetical protein n=2 Tax=Gottfriedia acidiceleris TaxID=371036 RepID=UPI002FFE9034
MKTTKTSEFRTLYKKFQPIFLSYNDIQDLYHVYIKQTHNTRDIVEDFESFGEERILQILSETLGAKCNFTMFQEINLFNIEGIKSIFYHTLKDIKIYEILNLLKKKGKLKYVLYVYKLNFKNCNKTEFEQTIQIAYIL